MATQPTCGKIIKVTVHLRDKSTKIINENVCGLSGDCSEMMSLLDSTRSLQEKLNQFLSNLVENERRNGANESHDVNNVLVEEEEDDDDDDSSDDNNDASVQEPPVKQQKR